MTLLSHFWCDRAANFTSMSLHQPSTPPLQGGEPWQPSYTAMPYTDTLASAPGPPEEAPTIEWVLDKARSAVLR